MCCRGLVFPPLCLAARGVRERGRCGLRRPAAHLCSRETDEERSALELPVGLRIELRVGLRFEFFGYVLQAGPRIAC